jgi:hypothetical protein
MTNKDPGVPDILWHVLRDMRREYPEHTESIQSICYFLQRRFQRGVYRTLCVDLPKLGKAYDKGLSTHWIRPVKGWNLVPRVGHSIYPLIELTFYWREKHWVLRPNADPRLIFYTRTILSGHKKLDMEASEEVKSECIRDFFVADAQVREFEELFNSEKRKPLSLERDTDAILSAVCPRLLPMRAVEWKDLNFRHGPGAVADQSGRFNEKYTFPTWGPLAYDILPPYELAVHNMKGFLDPNSYDPLMLSKVREVPCKVTSVPKTLDKVRVITVESTANQFLQQGLRGWMLEKLPRVAKGAIDVSL